MAEDVGRRAATVAEARELLGVPRSVSGLPLSDVKVLDLTRLLPGRLLLAAARRPRRRGAEGRGHRDGRLHPLGAALLRRRGAAGARHPLGPLPLAQPRQALDPARPQERGRAGRRCCAWSSSYDVVLDGFRPGVLDRLGVGYERMREANPAIVFCAITGYGQDGPYTAARRPRHELPRPGRPARADRRQGRPAGPVGRPDRRPRRRRADGRLRGDGGAARAPPLRRGPDGRRLDGRRRPLLAGDGRRPLLLRRRGAAARRAAARRRPGLLPALRGGRRLGQLRRPGAEVLGRASATGSSAPT